MELPIKVGHWYRRRDGKLVKAWPESRATVSSGEHCVYACSGQGYKVAGRDEAPYDLVEHIAGPEWDEILQAGIEGKQIQANEYSPSPTTIIWRNIGLKKVMQYAQNGYRPDHFRVAPGQTGHSHADLMAQYAEDAKKTAEPWKLWEYDIGTGWLACSEHPSFKAGCNYRRRPITRWVNVYSGPEATGNACESREAADACAKPGRIGLLRISGDEVDLFDEGGERRKADQ